MKRVRLLLIFAALSVSVAASAQTFVFEIDPHQSRVDFTLGDVLHTVHGSFQLKGGSIRFDTTTGAAGGLITVDATSGDSGSHGRDHKMHKEILESAKYPEITFAPQHVSGQVPQDGKAQVTLTGLMTLHGQPHEMSINVPVEVHSGQAIADMGFLVPYVQWGLKNPSTFILRVSDKVDISVHAVGHIAAAAP
jgi:polyisoprenoid-binding protein YceI